MRKLERSLVLCLTASVLTVWASSASADYTCRALFEDVEVLEPARINHVLTGPADAPLIVLIHGLGGSLSTWTRVQESLQREFRVLSYDQRGHGKTPALGTNYSTEVMANDLKALLNSLGIRKPVKIIGHSLGARTAMKFGELFPERVESLILEDMDMQKRQEADSDKINLHYRMAAAYKKLKPVYPTIEALAMELIPLFGDVERAVRRAKRISFFSKKTGLVYVDERPEVTTLYGVQGNLDNFGPALREFKKPILFMRADPRLSPFFNDAGVEHIRRNSLRGKIIQFEGAEHTIHFGPTFAPYMNAVREFFAP